MVIDNGKIKLSIVIPYYETFELTMRLLKGLSVQVNDKVEIILIDDYCKKEFHNMKDELKKWNVNLIEHKENKGVAGARNKGIEVANGKYIAFIDSDDMVMPNYIESLLKLIDEHDEDVMVFNWMDINTNQIVRHPCNPSVWKAIYKKEIIPRFEECYKTREDYFFNEELDKGNFTRYYYDKVLYIYNSGRENSLTDRSQKGEI